MEIHPCCLPSDAICRIVRSYLHTQNVTKTYTFGKCIADEAVEKEAEEGPRHGDPIERRNHCGEGRLRTKDVREADSR